MAGSKRGGVWKIVLVSITQNGKLLYTGGVLYFLKKITSSVYVFHIMCTKSRPGMHK